MDYYEIGQRIRKYRKAMGFSQEQLAETVGISTTHMSHIETGNTKLSLPVLVRTAEALSVRVDALLYEVPPESRTELSQEIARILDSCTPEESRILTDLLRAGSQTLRKNL